MHVGFRMNFGAGYEASLKLAAKLGFVDLEPVWNAKLSPEYPIMGKMAREMGIKLSAALTGTDPMSRADFKQAFDDCARIGATTFVSHPHALKEDDQAAQREFQERFGAAAEMARKAGLKLAVHSCGLGPNQWDLMFRLVPELWLKYDPSFSAQAGRNYVSEIFKYGKRIAHVHAKDEMPLERATDYNVGIIPMTYAPPGMGQIQWGSVIAALYEVGYDGQIAIEPHSLYWVGAGLERGLILGKRHLEQFIA